LRESCGLEEVGVAVGVADAVGEGLGDAEGAGV